MNSSRSFSCYITNFQLLEFRIRVKEKLKEEVKRTEDGRGHNRTEGGMKNKDKERKRKEKENEKSRQRLLGSEVR